MSAYSPRREAARIVAETLRDLAVGDGPGAPAARAELAYRLEQRRQALRALTAGADRMRAAFAELGRAVAAATEPLRRVAVAITPDDR